MKVNTDTIFFNAQWEAHLSAFKPDDSRIKKIIYNIVSVVIPIIGLCRLANWGLKKLCSKLILQVDRIPEAMQSAVQRNFNDFWFSDCPHKKNSVIRNFFHASPFQLTTPDQVSLSGTLFKHKDSDETTPTLILFQGNATLSKMDIHRWMLENSIFHERPCNFVIFDYRSTGESEGSFNSTDDLVLDADTVYQFVRDHLQTPEDRIHFFGYSLGGGVSAQLSVLHPNAQRRHVFDRTFADLPSVVRAHAGNNPISSLASWILRYNKFDLNTLGIWNELQGRKIVTYHPEDWIIPPPANLALNIDPKDADIMRLRTAQGYVTDNAHCDSIICQEDEKGTWADQRIMDFLLEEPALAKEQVLSNYIQTTSRIGNIPRRCPELESSFADAEAAQLE